MVFFFVKVLYKSRCDNRLNEIIERVAADKREVSFLVIYVLIFHLNLS